MTKKVWILAQTFILNLRFAQGYNPLAYVSQKYLIPSNLLALQVWEYKWINFSFRSICSEAVLHRYKDIDTAFTISPLQMFSQTWFSMKKKKRRIISTFVKMHHSYSSIILPHWSGFYRETEDKMKCIAAGIWHFGFNRENPMASFEEADAAASMQSANGLLYTWRFGKNVHKNKEITHERLKLLTWLSHFLLLDY